MLLLASIFIIFIVARLFLGINLYLRHRNKYTVKTMIILGSGKLHFVADVVFEITARIYLLFICTHIAGGHTAEMMTLLGSFDRSIYTPRNYVVAATDAMSGQKATAFENQKIAALSQERGSATNSTPPPPPLEYSITAIPRAREVGQSFRSSIFTTLRAFYHAAFIVFSHRPDVLLSNGPGTALPLIVAAVVGRCLGVVPTKIVYIESIARVKQLSLTGKIVYHCRLSDEFLVQWEELAAVYSKRAHCAGRLM